MQLKNISNKAKLPNFIYVILYLIISSCSNENSPIIEENYDTELTQIQFLKSNNPSLPSDITLELTDNYIWANMPLNTDMEQLVATFSTNSKKTTIDNIEQVSNITSNDFTKPITYTLTGSNSKTEEYTIELTKFTGLPIVYLNTNNQPIDSKETYRTGTINIDGNSNYTNLSNGDIEIRGRGNSTWWTHPKKPYQMKFEDKTEFLDMPKDKKWIFLAEYSDKTLIRNKIVFEMGHLSTLDWTPKSEYAEVFINNQYVGTYNIAQKLETGKNRVNIGDDGYLLEIDQKERLDPDDIYFTTNNFLINIKEPEIEMNSDSYLYIKDLINDFETTLYGSNFKDPTNGYAKHINVDSFIDWYLISEICKNQDSKDFSSIYLNVKPGEKIKMGPLWDFDLAFGNVDYSNARYPEGFWVKDHKWYRQFFKDPNFVAKVKTRFAYYKTNENLILEKIDNFAKQLQWAQEENNKKWHLFGNKVWPNPIVFNSHREEVNHLKDWYIKRMNWLDTALNNL